MKKKVLREVEVDVCSACGKESGMSFECFTCDYVTCWDCSDNSAVMVKYSHGVYDHGSMDGWYCRACDLRLSEDKSDLLHNAYVEVRALRDELRAWSADFETRQESCEALAERLFRVFDAKRRECEQ